MLEMIEKPTDIEIWAKTLTLLKKMEKSNLFDETMIDKEYDNLDFSNSVQTYTRLKTLYKDTTLPAYIKTIQKRTFIMNISSFILLFTVLITGTFIVVNEHICNNCIPYIDNIFTSLALIILISFSTFLATSY